MKKSLLLAGLVMIPIILIRIFSFYPIRQVYAQTYAPPIAITLTMYALTAAGGRTNTLCDNNTHASDYGCTAIPDNANYTYPYQANPVQVSIESDYLLDVVPQELGTYYEPLAIRAQAIAARSYAYYKIHTNQDINNSAGNNQTFLPYKFESYSLGANPNNASAVCASTNLNGAQQTICNAVAERFYLSSADADAPAFTEFFSDAFGRTADGGTAHLRGILDPISTACDANDAGHLHGMSGEGASRWARGHQCSYGNATPVTGNPPGGPWSVRWTDYRQILVHYYTGVHLRDANRTILTPDYRWNLLQYDPPAVLVLDDWNPATIVVQNTGTAAISENQFGLVGAWCNATDSNCPTRAQLLQSASYGLPSIEAGDVFTVTKMYGPPDGGNYRLVWDICTMLSEGIPEDERWCFAFPTQGEPWVLQQVGAVPVILPTATPPPTATFTPLPPTATPTARRTATPTRTAGTPAATATPAPGWAAVEEVVLEGLPAKQVLTYSRLLSNLRDRIMLREARGQVYVDLTYQHAPELLQMMQVNPKLRARVKRLALRIQPELEEWLDYPMDARRQVNAQWLRQAQRTLRAVSRSASPELQAEIGWWEARLPGWEQKTLPQIWEALLAEQR